MSISSLLSDCEAREEDAFRAFEGAYRTYENWLISVFGDRVSDIRNSHAAKGEPGSLLRAGLCAGHAVPLRAFYNELMRTRSEWVLARSALKLLREKLENQK